MIAFENKDKSVLILTAASPLFYCGICNESHIIDNCDINETTDKTGYVVVCQITGQCVEFDKEKDCVV